MMAVILFLSESYAARIVSVNDNYLFLRSEQPDNNFIGLVFPKLKDAIIACADGDWRDWQTSEEKGRSCGQYGWSKNLRTGCEGISIYDSLYWARETRK